MKITILQRDIVWGEPVTNVARADEAIDRNPGADLYVLPEMFSTGFCTIPEGVAESTDSDTLKWMQRKAAATNAAIAGSVAVTDGEHYYNRFYFVRPDGTTEYYDKHHLFTFGGEHLRFTAGDRRVIVEWRGVYVSNANLPYFSGISARVFWRIFRGDFVVFSARVRRGRAPLPPSGGRLNRLPLLLGEAVAAR